jgi:pyruvate kinase
MGQLLSAGVNVFRINTAHGNPEQHVELIRRVRALSRDRAVGILLDTRGPKVRVAELPEPVPLEQGEEILLGERGIPITPPGIVASVPVGARILLGGRSHRA